MIENYLQKELNILVVSVHGELRGCWLQDTSKSSRIRIGRNLEQQRRLPIKLLGSVINLH